MRLFVVQHGDAVPKDVDPDRPLSDRGRADLQLLLEFLATRNTRIDQIFHSGKARARETAEILRPLLKMPGELYEREGLAPSPKIYNLLRHYQTLVPADNAAYQAWCPALFHGH